MKTALAQMEVVAGKPRQNLENMLRLIQDAKREHVDLVVFPEMCLGGYLVGDKWASDEFCRYLMECNDTLREASGGIAIAYGNIYLDTREEINARQGDTVIHPNKDGRARKYNAVYVFQNRKAVPRLQEPRAKILPEGVQPKTLLPNYRIFDDERHFFSLEDIAKDAGATLEDLAQPFVLEADGKKIPIGFEVCEDLWCEEYRRDGKAQNVTKILIDNGAERVVSISASPWTFGKNAARDRRVKFLKQDSGNSFVPFLYVNCTGAQNNGKNIVTFDGGSTAYNEHGDPVALSHSHKEGLLIVDDEDFHGPTKALLEKPKVAQKLECLLAGIRHMKDVLGRTEQPKYVIGLSGGIDSSVVAALLTLAVGKDKVLGVTMPWEYTSQKTRQSVDHLVQKLGISLLEVPIGELAALNQRILETYTPDGDPRIISPLQRGNIAAKIRGTSLLSNIAALYGALFTNNGNKLEVALGYATLYGDVNGAIAPLADLTKTEVVELARYLNEQVFQGEAIPQTLIPDSLFRFTSDQIQPSAELEKDQVDPMKFGYHCALLEAMTDYRKKSAEDIMRSYLTGTLEQQLGINTELLPRWGLQNPKVFLEDLEWFDTQIQRNVFKRVQAPPIIITSKSAYGYDIRESILPPDRSFEYDRLKEQVLAMKEYAPAGAQV